jgi:rod shape-determining protein MreD
MLKYVRTSWLHIVLVLIAVLLDGSLALYGAQVLFKTPMSASPFLTIIVLMMPVIAGVRSQLSNMTLYGIAMGAGLLFDLYYNGVIGIAMIGFPLTVWISTLVQQYFVPGFWSAMASWFVSMSFYLVFDYFGFGVINLVTMSIPNFIVFHLFPSLLINLVLFIIFYGLLAHWYDLTKQPDSSKYGATGDSLAERFSFKKR